MSASLAVPIPSLREIDAALDRRSLLRFGRRVFRGKFQVNWHHELMADYLDDFAAGKIANLMIFAPPRHSKSEFASRLLPAKMMGRNPDLQIIACSHTAALAERMNRDVQRIMDSSAYRELFPRVRLPASARHSGSEVRNSHIFEIVGYKGAYVDAGVGGPITGMGAHVGIIDDPIKNAKEADSKTVRDSQWEWYTTTFLTRLEHNAQKLIVMTRWHEDDLCGRLLKAAAENPRAEPWAVLRLPAIADDLPRHPRDLREVGEPLWPEKKSFDELEAIRLTQGSYRFSAMYQGRPTPAEGGVFKRSWLGQWHGETRLYKDLPQHFDIVAISWDCAFKNAASSSYVVGQVWGRRGSAFYLLDQVRAKMSFSETCIVAVSLSEKWPQATAKYIEDKANGTAVIDALGARLSGLIAVSPEGGKESRAAAVSPLFEAGNVWLPDPSIAPWVHDYIEEMVDFPNSIYDDQVDATSQALARIGIQPQATTAVPTVIEAYGSAGRWSFGDS